MVYIVREETVNIKAFRDAKEASLLASRLNDECGRYKYFVEPLKVVEEEDDLR